MQSFICNVISCTLDLLAHIYCRLQQILLDQQLLLLLLFFC